MVHVLNAAGGREVAGAGSKRGCRYGRVWQGTRRAVLSAGPASALGRAMAGATPCSWNLFQ